ncbi:Tautomerase/MIF superfamily [Phlebopus sp. FC_14]|nr:Tautomerase/MIF superfamily [Phlebopus sp. FC_14]
MPSVTLITNVKLASDEATKAFVLELSKFCAKTIGKDEKGFHVNFQYNPFLAYGGTFEPAVALTTASLFNTNAENAKIWSKAFSEFFQERIGVPKDRGYMSFVDPDPALLGMRGTTAAEIFKKS